MFFIVKIGRFSSFIFIRMLAVLKTIIDGVRRFELNEGGIL